MKSRRVTVSVQKDVLVSDQSWIHIGSVGFRHIIATVHFFECVSQVVIQARF